MPWVTDSRTALIDRWDPDLGNRTWFRKLDEDNNRYLYRYDQRNPHQSTLFGTAQDAHAPGPITANTFLISDQTALELYRTGLALTTGLAGALHDVSNNVAPVQGPALALSQQVSTQFGDADARANQALAGPENDRNRVFRQGIRFMLDAAGNVRIFVQNNVLPAPYPDRLRSVAARLDSLGNQLYQALQ